MAFDDDDPPTEPASGPDPALPPPPASGPGPVAPPVPPPSQGVPPVAPGSPGMPPGAWTAPAPPPRRRRLALGLGALGVVLGVIAIRVVLGIITATVVSSALTSLFGGPYQRLPAEQRAQLDSRMEAALGSDFDSLSEARQSARLEELITGGLPRLDDARLVDRLGLFVTLITATDTATCATLARTSVAGAVDEDAAAKAVEALATEDLGRWVEIHVAAIEAESSGAPATRTADEARVDALFTDLIPRLSATDVATLGSLSSGTEVADDAACLAFRDLYGAFLDLAPEDRAAIALYDVTP